MWLPTSYRRLLRVTTKTFAVYAACAGLSVAVAESARASAEQTSSGAPIPLPAGRAARPAAPQTGTIDGPWTGSVQCRLTVNTGTYQETQTHTWRFLSGERLPFNRWPAVWTVEGTGSRQTPLGEKWTIAVPETSAPITVRAQPGTGQIEIRSEHGLLVASGAITVTSTTAQRSVFSLQEWSFPVIQSAATSATISGTRTRTIPWPGNGWRVPSSEPSEETCAWNLTRGGVAAPQTTTASQAPAPTSPTPTAAPAGGSLMASGSTSGVTLNETMKLCTTVPAPQYSVTPGGVSFTLNRPSGITGYRISRRDLGELTPSPITASLYTHAAPLEYQTTYDYGITGVQADGGCTMVSVNVTGPKPLTPQVTATVTASSPSGGSVTLSWGTQADRPTGYLVLGAGLPQEGTEVAALLRAMQHSLAVSNLPAGTHAWLVTPLWKTPAGTLIDVGSGARVTVSVGGGATGAVPQEIWDNLSKAASAYHDMLMNTAVAPR